MLEGMNLGRTFRSWASWWQTACLRQLLRPLVRWRPLGKPLEGYSLVLGCSASLTELLDANLMMVRRQQRDHLRMLHIVFDEPANDRLIQAANHLRRAFPDLPLRFHYFTPLQSKVLAWIAWGWAYAWLSWCIGIKHARTRHVLIHDLDFLPLKQDFFLRRYQAVCEQQLHYLGMQHFAFNGFTAKDGLMVSNQLMLDAVHVRGRHRPLDLFVKQGRLNGKPVHFDLTLYAQSFSDRRALLPLRPLEIVHPSQMICQFTALMTQADYQPQQRTSLLLIPYYLYLGGHQSPLRDMARNLPSPSSGKIRFFGKLLDLSRQTPEHIRVLATMAYEVEEAMFGRVRPEIHAYFERLIILVTPAGSEYTRPAAA